MAKTTINNGDSGLVVRNALNTMFTELYGVPVVRTQTFVASGTYTPNAQMVSCLVRAVGGGGGGGGAAQSGAGGANWGGGGGGGGYAEIALTAAQVGASQAVTIGAAAAGGVAGNNNGADGVDTSFGVLCIAKGGTHGNGSASNSPALGGSGGVAGTGDFSVAGMRGGYGQGGTTVGVTAPSGVGGHAGLAFGAGGFANANGIGIVGASYGGGGSGGSSNAASAAAAGGAGATGIVIVTEYCSA